MGEEFLGKIVNDEKTVCRQHLKFLFICSEGLLHLDPIFIGQPFQGLWVGVFFMLHDETDRISAAAATKTLIDLFSRGNRKRGAFFIVKRAEAQVIGPSFFQLYEIANNLEDIQSSEYLLYGGR